MPCPLSWKEEALTNSAPVTDLSTLTVTAPSACLLTEIGTRRCLSPVPRTMPLQCAANLGDADSGTGAAAHPPLTVPYTAPLLADDIAARLPLMSSSVVAYHAHEIPQIKHLRKPFRVRDAKMIEAH